MWEGSLALSDLLVRIQGRDPVEKAVTSAAFLVTRKIPSTISDMRNNRGVTDSNIHQQVKNVRDGTADKSSSCDLTC